MPSRDAHQIAERSERIYNERLRAKLEKTHTGRFVAIEPDSGEHFLGETLSEASAGSQAGASRETIVHFADRTEGCGPHWDRAMTGVVDDFGRALVPIRLKKPAVGRFIKVQAWIDTGFTGELVLPKAVVRSLGLTSANVVKAELGDGSIAVIHTYSCELDWFGDRRIIEALETTGEHPLIGATLLMGHRLVIDYERGGVQVT